MGRRADEFDPPLDRSLVGCGADERRQQGMVDVDDRHAECAQELA